MRASAIAPPNIALIKYWGKRHIERNQPAVGSLSITLDGLWTAMDVCFDQGLEADTLSLNGADAPRLLPRVSRCLDRIGGERRPHAEVHSRCNFPVAAGLASSASSFAALVVAASRALGQDRDTLELARLAGAASGSAARSLYDGFVELGLGDIADDDNDIDVESIAAPDEWPLDVIVAVTAAGEKPISSGDAMRQSASSSPFYQRWVDDQPGDLAAARAAVHARDFARLADLSEHNCLKMHSVMWTTRPSVVYWNSVTLACMQTVRDLRHAGTPVFFTIDAGPQVKAVCSPEAADHVAEALRGVDGVIDIMHARLGVGARLTDAT